MAEPTNTQGRTEWIGRTIDYLFGRNTLIGIASLMLLTISGYATWSGMQDFIVGVSTSPASQGREIPGGLSVSNELLVIAIVVALTFLMWLALRESFGARRTLTERLVTLPLYLFLALWSIGFGYGFWWSLIAGEEATRTSLWGLQEDARDAGAVVSARIDAVKSQLDSVVTWSESQMAREESSGGSCGVSSGAGRGPLYNARRSVRDQIASLRDNVTGAWIGPVQEDLDKLRQTASQLEGPTVLERQQSFEAMAARIRGTARSIAARSNELGRSTAAEMHALAGAVAIEPGKPGFSCYDPTLAQRLRQAAEQSAQPAVLNLREAEFTEGPAGVANAVKNLWSNIGDYVSSTMTFVVSLGQDTGEATAGGQPISGRDLIALLATLGIDLGLFALTVLNPPTTPPVRHQPSSAVTRQVREAIHTAIARAPDADMEWVRRHFIYHRGTSYFIIPNLFSCDPENKSECARALAMNQLAGVFDDLNLVRWPDPGWPKWSRGKRWRPQLRKGELRRLIEEENHDSDTDVTAARKRQLKKLEKENAELPENERVHLDQAKAERIRRAEPIRNHGLLSKAERALAISGWSEKATRDFEVYCLENTEGLTPLLTVLNEPIGGDPSNKKGAEPSTAVPSVQKDKA